MSQENVEVVRRVWDAAQRGDTTAVFELYDPAIVWEVHYGAPELKGVYEGYEGVRRLFEQWREPFEAYHEHVETLIDAGASVLAGVRLGGRGVTSGAEVDFLSWVLYAVRDGRVIRVDVFGGEDEALEAAGLKE